MSNASNAGAFSGRVTVLFGTQAFGAVLGIFNGILIARLLGPAAKGDYYLLVLLPSTAMVLVQLGLSLSFAYFAARGQTAGLVARALLLTAVLSLVAFLAFAILLPALRSAVLHGIALGQILLVVLALPLILNATFMTAIVMGRQAVRWYAAVNMAYPVVTTALLIIVLGGLGGSVTGAVAVYLVTAAVQSIGFSIGAKRVSTPAAVEAPVSYRELFGYGLRFYPASLTQFFSYRIDAYLIAFLMVDAAEPLGYYSLAVGLAEMVFFFPNAVSTLFFPHVAGSARDDADRQVAMVSRVTLLVTGAVSILLIPAAAVLIWTVLPAFGPSLPPFIVLLPGIVALSATKVVGGYVAGIGKPGTASVITVLSFALNALANLVLIPALGIVGAATASLLSYSFSALLITGIAARLTKTPLLDFWIARPSDVRFIVGTSLNLVRRLVPNLRGHA